jgi:hypothetical protein
MLRRVEASTEPILTPSVPKLDLDLLATKAAVNSTALDDGAKLQDEGVWLK